MKPQCETAAQCLKELARVMEQFGIIGTLAAINSKYVRLEGERAGLVYVSEFYRPEDWQFAIAEVEGKPVFIGDELYSVVNGNKYTATESGWHFDNWTHGPCTDIQHMSWKPPHPKTINIELPFEVALVAKKWDKENRGWVHDDIAQACKLALEKLNETNTRTD